MTAPCCLSLNYCLDQHGGLPLATMWHWVYGGKYMSVENNWFFDIRLHKGQSVLGRARQLKSHIPCRRCGTDLLCLQKPGIMVNLLQCCGFLYCRPERSQCKHCGFSVGNTRALCSARSGCVWGELDKVFMLCDLSCCIILTNQTLESRSAVCLCVCGCTTLRTSLSPADLWQLWFTWHQPGICEGSCCLRLWGLWKSCGSVPPPMSPSAMTEFLKKLKAFSNCCSQASQHGALSNMKRFASTISLF